MSGRSEDQGASLRCATVLSWFAAAALLWSIGDLAQVRLTVAGQGFRALASLTGFLYFVVGLASGLFYLGLRRFLPERWRQRPSEVALALTFWGLIVVGAYVNVVYLPSPSSGTGLVANAVLIAVAVASWRLIARSRILACIARGPWAVALACMVVAAAAGFIVSTPVAPKDSVSVRTRPTTSPANVFVIAIDTLRYDYTGLAAGGRASTPALVRLAAGGMQFGRAYAQASWTKPSVASLFTSLYPSTHGANLRRDRLSEEPVTLPVLMREAGYTTAVFSANPWISPAFGFDRGVDRFYEVERESFSRLVLILRLIKLSDRAVPGGLIADTLRWLEDGFGVRQPKRTNWQRDEAVAGLFEQWLSTEPRTPLFAYIHLMSPHIPYAPPGSESLFAHQDQVALLQSELALSPDRERVLRDLYEDSVEHADRIVARLVAALDEAGLVERSVIVVTADHGEEFYEHGRWGHGKSLYDELVRVPLIIAGPGVPHRQIAENPVMLVDVLPTAAAIAGVAPNADWEGSNLLHPVAGRSAYAELLREGGLASFMLVSGGRKYLETVMTLGSSARHELYDLTDDPSERHDLSAGTASAAWHEQLVAVREAAETKRVTADSASIGTEADERLRALGYVN